VRERGVNRRWQPEVAAAARGGRGLILAHIVFFHLKEDLKKEERGLVWCTDETLNVIYFDRGDDSQLCVCVWIYRRVLCR
jgi:hypothetical protein